MPVTFKSSASAASNSVAIPAHDAGDIIVLFAYRHALAGGASTPPTKPTAGGTVPAWVDITNNTGASANSARTAYVIATGSGTTTGTWSLATSIIVAVLRGQYRFSPIGGSSEQSALPGTTASTSLIAPAVAMVNTLGGSQLLHFFGAVRPDGTAFTWNTAPSGYTAHSTLSGGSGSAAGCRLLLKNVTTSDGAVTNTVSATCFGRAATIEIVEQPSQFWPFL